MQNKNPTWDFSQCSREIGDELRNSIVRFTFRLWDCSPDRSDPVCIIETAIRLYRLSYVGVLLFFLFHFIFLI